MTDPDPSYALLDCGDGRRLERFGGVVVSRPAAAAAFPTAGDAARWRDADLAFDRESGWRGEAPAGWRVRFGPALLNLRPAAGGQIGAFPEHAAVAERLNARLDARTAPADGRRALNLFAHTGLATLRLAARTDVAATTHVDAAPAAVRAARDNAAAAGLADRPVRWLVDDALGFLRKEARRDSQYEVIVADPPAYGRSRKGGEWKLEKDLPELLALCARLLADDGVLCLTCHRDGWTSGQLTKLLRGQWPRPWRGAAENLSLRSESGGNALPAGLLALVEDDQA